MNAPLPLPKYHQVYLVLRERLEDGRFAHGVPGEMVLMKEFGVARVTVRRALERLAAEGLIERAPGRGTVAVQRPAGRPEGEVASSGADPGARARLTGLLENIVSMGLKTQVEVVGCELMPAPQAVASRLALAEGEPVHKAVRVR
ncbi:MAG: GntR family transcriptional regulator, partial [Rubrivivax sp.]